VLALVVGFFWAREWSSSVVTAEDEGAGNGMRIERSERRSRGGTKSGGFAGRMRELEDGGFSWEDDQRKFFKEWFREDPEAALDAMRNSRLGLGDEKPFFLLFFLFEDDPKGMEAMGRYLPEIITSGYWHESGFDGEVERYFDFRGGKELVDKVAGLPESDMKEELWKYAMAGWFYADWKGAKSHVMGLPEKERRVAERAFLSERMPRWVSSEADGRAWIEEILDAEGNRDLLTWHGPKLAVMMAKDDPKGALEWAGEHLGGIALANAVTGTVKGLIYQDGTEEAGNIVDELLPGGVREQAARELVLGAARKDAVAAFERAVAEEGLGMKMGVQTWQSLGRMLGRTKPEEALRILGTSEGLEKAFGSSAMGGAFEKEPEKARQWAESMEGSRREEMIDLVYQAWRFENLKEAKAWRDSLVKD